MKKKIKRTIWKEVNPYSKPLSEEERDFLCQVLLSNDLEYAKAMDRRIQEFINRRVPIAGYAEMQELLKDKRVLTGVNKVSEINITHKTEPDLDNLSVEELKKLEVLLSKVEGPHEGESIH